MEHKLIVNGFKTHLLDFQRKRNKNREKEAQAGNRERSIKIESFIFSFISTDGMMIVLKCKNVKIRKNYIIYKNSIIFCIFCVISRKWELFGSNFIHALIHLI